MTITLTLHLRKKIKLIRNYKKKSGIGYYPKKIIQVIKAVMFNIDNHENDILAVGYEKKQLKLKTNGTN